MDGYRTGDPPADRVSAPAKARSGLVFAGLQGMEDPVRPEAVEAVRAAHAAGIRVLMLTGDHLDTARAIGRQLGLDRNGEGALEGSVRALGATAVGAIARGRLDGGAR